MVRGVRPGNAPWVIKRLSADVKSDGRISVDGRGLLIAGDALAAGTNGIIGTNAGQTVRARLFCGISLIGHDSDPVPLDAAGDFRIEDTLVPVPPDECPTRTLLILQTSDVWVAAGIPKQLSNQEEKED